MKTQALTASALKDIMWESMLSLKEGETDPNTANAMATTCREILRVVRLQLQVSTQAKRDVSPDVILFAEK